MRRWSASCVGRGARPEGRRHGGARLDKGKAYLALFFRHAPEPGDAGRLLLLQCRGHGAHGRLHGPEKARERRQRSRARERARERSREKDGLIERQEEEREGAALSTALMHVGCCDARERGRTVE